MSGSTHSHILGVGEQGAQGSRTRASPEAAVSPTKSSGLWALARAWTPALGASSRYQCTFHLAFDCNLSFQKVKCLVWASVATQTAEQGGSMSSLGIVWA